MVQHRDAGARLSADAYRDRWSRLHHGIQPSGIVVLWLRVMWSLATPLARARVSPDAVTVCGALAAVAAAGLAGPWPGAALLLVLGSALCDGLDGAVAVVADRPSRHGRVLDTVADRVADAAFAVALWRCGAPGWIALSAGAVSQVHEAVRAALGGVLRSTITVGERPVRVICPAIALALAATGRAGWPLTTCAGVWLVLGLAGLSQLLFAYRRRG